MNRTRLALPILLGIIVALWGCTNPSSQPARTAEANALETRVSKLEKDLKLAQEQVNSVTRKLQMEEAKTAKLAVERDEAVSNLRIRSEEYSKAQSDLEQVRTGLRDLLQRVDSALLTVPVPLPVGEGTVPNSNSLPN